MAAGTLINHHRTGSGPPLVLIHGIGATWQCWKPVIPGLAAHHEVFAVDLPGFGGSASLAVERPSLQQFAAAVLELMDSYGIQDFHVVGNSMGGAVGIELLESGRVLSYTGISPAGQTLGPYLAVTKALLRVAYYGSRALRPVAPRLVKLRPLRIALIGAMIGKPGRLTAEYALDLIDGCGRGSGFPQTLAHALPLDRPLDVPAYDGPAQMLWGSRDLILPISALGRFAAAWPRLETHTMPGLGHVPMQDDPGQIVSHTLALTSTANRAANPPG